MTRFSAISRWRPPGWLVAGLVASLPVAGSADGALPRPWYLQGGGYIHYESDDDHEGAPLVLGIEYHKPSQWFGGFTIFNNSFDQFSQYAYLGRAFRPLDAWPGLRLKLSAGIVQGYRGEHADALPVRWEESWGLGVVPSVGYQKGRIGFDVAFLKESAVLFLFGYQF